MEPKKIVRLSCPGGAFEEAWRGRLVPMSERVAAGAGDILVLGLLAADGREVPGREVQGHLVVDRGEDGVVRRCFSPTLRWDLRRPT